MKFLNNFCKGLLFIWAIGLTSVGVAAGFAWVVGQITPAGLAVLGAVLVSAFVAFLFALSEEIR